MKLTDAQVIREMMTRHDEARVRWFANFGTYDGFDQWFTGQVIPAAPDVDPYDRWAATDREC